jgi:hypothetical protein
MNYKPSYIRDQKRVGQDTLNKQALEYLLACGKLDKDGRALLTKALADFPYGVSITRRKDKETGKPRFIEISIVSGMHRRKKILGHGSFTIPHWDFNNKAEEITL